MLNKEYFSLPVSQYIFLNNSCSNEIKIPSITFKLNGNENVRSENDYSYLNMSINVKDKVLCSDIINGYHIQLDAMSLNDSAHRDHRTIPFQTDVINELKQDLLFKNYGMNGMWKINVSVINKNKELVSGPFITQVNVK